MKKYLLILLALVSLSTAFGYQIIPEQVTIGEQKKPDASAALELRGTGRGLLINRLTSTERDAIAAPATGLVIFNSTANILEFYNGSSWIPATGGSITEWIALADYVMNDIVVDDSKIYRALDNHTATADFDTDFLAGHWELLSGGIKPPVGATDNALIRFDGATGDSGQNSLAILDDTGNLSGLQSLVIGGSLDASSILDVLSTGKGARPCPAMTETQRDAITSPATSLCIYNTTQGKLNIYNGAIWKAAGGGIEPWETAFAYSINDVVIQSSKIYQALTAHTSGTFATDLANGDWVELSAPPIIGTDLIPFGDGTNVPVTSTELQFDTGSNRVYLGAGTSSSNGTLTLGGSGTGVGTIDGGGGALNIVGGPLTLETHAPGQSITLNPGGSTGFVLDTNQDGQFTGNLLIEENLDVDGTATIGSLSGVVKANAGLLSASALNLTTDVTGVLPLLNGGTGNTTGTATINAALTGMVTTNGTTNVASLGSFTSANLAAALTNETGTLLTVFSNSPTFTGSPVLADALGTSLSLGGTKAASAVLDVQSTTQGVLTPRMTTAQMNAISSPATGLTIYNTDFSSMATYNGTTWTYGFGNLLTGVNFLATNLVGISATADVTKLVFTTKNTDTNSAYNTTTGEYTIPEDDYYTVYSKTDVAMSGYNGLAIWKNSTKLATGTMVYSGPLFQNVTVQYSGTFAKGDVVTIRPYNYAGAATATFGTNSANGDLFSVFKLPRNTSAWVQANSNPSVTTTEFTAQSDISAGVSRLNVSGWVANGSIVSSVYTFPITGFTVAPNCWANSSTQGAGSVRIVNVASTSSNVLIEVTGSAGSGATTTISFGCQKSGVDYLAAHSPFIIGTFAGVPYTPGYSGRVETFSVSYGTTNATTACTTTPCSYLDQIGTAVTSITKGITGNYTMNTAKTYAKLKCSGWAGSTVFQLIFGAACSSCNAMAFQTGGFPSGANLDSFGTLTCQGTY